ncbi:lipopolysaccharide heptosyltransferase I [Campylobacter fetus]|uniref:lipopolysaccharide heptosyltransferase I n=1 Tax=Campylobacter fetus TaxID=196 RepID=UPI000818C226|nr:lipopolysaccharide heptosyltransferase I [Campylobacter fetus]OCR94772.1 lipopolysaccharide heptosyltransferase [Campylobacter fetus subsp. testudinum]
MKIAIIKLSSLGDIVHTVIVLQFIKKYCKAAEISWFVDEKFGSILDYHQDIKEVVKLPLKDKKFVKTYKILSKFRNKFDIIIDFQGLIKSAIVGRILGKNVVGFDKLSVKEPLCSMFYSTKINCDYNENIIIRNLTLASKALDFKFNTNQIDNKLPCFAASDDDFDFLDKNSKNLLIAPFASEKSKCYDKFKTVINGLKECNILISFGSQKEKEKALELTKNTHAKLLPALSLNHMINLINKVDLVIGNDSGITHIAWAQNRASITIFGNRPSRRNAYKTDKNIVLDAGKKVDAKCIDKSDFCVCDIDPNLVIKEAKRLLDE